MLLYMSYKYDMILFIIILLIIYLFCRLPSVEKMSNIDKATEDKIREIYKIDTDAIRNLSNLAKDLTVGGKLTVPGGLEIKGALKMNKTGHNIGSNNYTMELFTPNDVNVKETSIRFHQGNKYWSQIRCDNTGFRLTNGSNNTLTSLATSSLNSNNIITSSLSSQNTENDKLNYINIGGTTNQQQWLRFRRGGNTPAGNTGCIFSNYSSNNFFMFNDDSFKINYDNTNIDGKPKGSGAGVLGTTLLTLDKNGNLIIKGNIDIKGRIINSGRNEVSTDSNKNLNTLPIGTTIAVLTGTTHPIRNQTWSIGLVNNENHDYNLWNNLNHLSSSSKTLLVGNWKCRGRSGYFGHHGWWYYLFQRVA
jgi:hypothetical protein